MRLLAYSFAAALASMAGAAFASPPLDLSSLPKDCEAVAEVPASATIADPAFSARVSGATCEIDSALSPVPLNDSDASIRALDSATAPVLARLDDVAARGGAKWQIISAYWKADIVLGLQTRLRAAIPPIGAKATLEHASQIERRHQALEHKMEPWDARATADFRRVTELARANPGVANADPVMQYMTQVAARYTNSAKPAKGPNARR
jgi:hypothetical protein